MLLHFPHGGRDARADLLATTPPPVRSIVCALAAPPAFCLRERARAIGSIGLPVEPRSLYLAQLRERLGGEALENIGYGGH